MAFEKPISLELTIVFIMQLEPHPVVVSSANDKQPEKHVINVAQCMLYSIGVASRDAKENACVPCRNGL